MWRSFWLMCGLFVLAGCSSLPLTQEKRVSCPTTGFLSVADHWVTIDPNKNIPMFKAVFGSVKGLCQIGNGQLAMDVDLELNAQFNPEQELEAYPEQIVKFFISATDNDLNILNKQTYTAKVTFDNTGVAKLIENVQFNVPAQSRAQLEDLKILIGFQLSKAQLDYSREKGKL